MDKGWVGIPEASILVDPGEQEAVLVTPFNRFALQGFWIDLSAFSSTPWKPFSSE